MLPQISQADQGVVAVALWGEVRASHVSVCAKGAFSIKAWGNAPGFQSHDASALKARLNAPGSALK
jgi:hypothetical protein